MKKGFKKIFWMTFVSSLAYLGNKAYKRIIGIKNISKTLPQYLENVVGEHPEFKLTSTLKTINLSFGFSKKTYDKLVDLESTVREYINDFYPVFPDDKVDIEIYVKSEEETVPEETESEKPEVKEEKTEKVKEVKVEKKKEETKKEKKENKEKK